MDICDLAGHRAGPSRNSHSPRWVLGMPMSQPSDFYIECHELSLCPTAAPMAKAGKGWQRRQVGRRPPADPDTATLGLNNSPFIPGLPLSWARAGVWTLWVAPGRPTARSVEIKKAHL